MEGGGRSPSDEGDPLSHHTGSNPNSVYFSRHLLSLKREVGTVILLNEITVKTRGWYS